MYSIYKIINLDTCRTYIGMTSNNIHHRFKEHLRDLRAKEHVNKFLQEDWNQGHTFIVAKIGSRKTKENAKALETKFINEQENPYNIARGNPGDLIGFNHKQFTPNNRRYMYHEITQLPKVAMKQVQARYDISAPMVSMIRNGHRTAPDPQTSFKDVFFCAHTGVQVENPPVSHSLNVYAGATQ